MKNFGVYRYIALIFTLLVVSTAVWGQTTYWIGGPGPASAAIPGNWSAGIPGAGDTAIINSDAQIEIPETGAIGTAIVDVGCTVEFIIQAETLTVGTQLQNNGNLTISGPGNLAVSGTANTGTLTIGAGGARNLGPLTNDGTLEVDTASVTCPGIGGPGSVTVSTGTINAEGSITTLAVSGGPATLNGTGAGLTAGGNPGGDIITTGTVTLTGAAFTNITNSGTLSLANPATLSGDMTLTAGSLTLGGDISVGGNWNDGGATFIPNFNAVSFTGAGNQSFTPGANTYDAVIVNKATGTFTVNINDLVCDNLTITNSADCTFNTAVTAPVLTLTATTGTIAFLNDLTVSGSFSNPGGNFDVNLYGTTTQMPAADFGTSGTMRLGNGDDTLTFGGEFTHTLGDTALYGTLATTSANVAIAALSLSGTAEINTSGGDINISGTVTNAAAQNLTLDAGTGNIQLTNTVGGGVTLNNISLTGTDITLGTGGGVNAGGTVTITNSGLLTINDRTSANDTGTWDIVAGGGFSQSGTGGVRLSGDISTTGNNITFAAAPELFGHVALSTGGGAAGDIEFNHAGTAVTHDGTPRNLILTAGDGSVQFTGSVATALAPLGLLTITSAAGGITANDTIDAQTVSITGGVVDLSGTVTADGGFSSTGTDFSNGGTITTDGNNLTINHTGAITIGAGLSSGNGNISVGAAASGTITLSDATPATTTGGNITFNRPVTLTVDAVISTGGGAGDIAFGASSSINGAQTLELIAGTGNIRFGTADGECPIGTTPLTSLTITSADDVTFYSTVDAGFVLQSDSGSTGTATFWRDVTTTTTGIDITNNIINLRGLTMTATGSDITLTGAVTLSDATVSLEATNDIGITGTVSGAQTLTINDANNVSFDNTVTVANLVQTTGSGTTTFVQNVTTSGATGIAINTTNIVLDGLTMTAGTDPAADIALTGVVTLSTADVVLQAEDAITITGTVDSVVAQSRVLTATSTNNGAISFAGLIGGMTPLASLTINGGDISLNGIGDNLGSGVTGIIDVDSTGAINLYANHYRSDGAQTWTATTGGVRYRATANGTWSAGGTGIDCSGTDVYLDHDGQILALESDLLCRNLYFYRGVLNQTVGNITTTGDLVVFGAGYNPVDGEWTVGNTRHAYFGADTLAYYPADLNYNNLTGYFDSNPNSSFAAGTTLNVGQNFYINGADMTTGTFTLNLNMNTGNNCMFNAADTVSAGQWGTPYAVAFNMTAADVNTTNGWVTASTNAQGVTIGVTTNNWQIARPVIRAARTIYDNVIHITFEEDLTSNLMAIENSNGQITAAMTSVVALANGGIWYDGGFIQFDGAFGNPECSIPPTNTPSEFYLRHSAGSWNTDATGGSAGDTDSTDRNGTTRTTIPNLSFLKGLLSAAEGKTMISNYGAHGEPMYTATTDRCQPVLVQVSTGQELHTSVLTDQLPYDAHNFIELRYSEEVDIGGFDTRPINTGFTSIYEKSFTTFNGTDEFGGAITPAGAGLEIAGYIRIDNGTLVTGTRGPHAAPAPNASDPTVHALYRDFSLDGAAAPVNQPHRLRISIAGWCEPLAPSFFWQGFITNAVTPSGAVTVLENVDITDLAGNVLDHTHGLPGVNSTEADLYSDWDTTPPDFAALRTYTDNWNDPLSAYELNPLASPGGLVNRIEMHFYDNRIDYSNPSETWKWQSRTGWYENTTATIEHPAPENFGGARPDRQLTGPFPTQPTSGGIRDSSFHNASSAFVIDNSGPTATGSDITNFTTGVNSPFYNILATLNVDDDPYITLHLNDLALGWPIATASIQVTYSNWFTDPVDGGFVTDLAGNLLGSQAGMQTLDRTPPEVTVSIAGANRDELYLVFSKNLAPIPPNFYDGIELQLQDPPATVLATSVEMPGGSTRVLHFRLDNTITANQLVSPGSMILFPSWGNAPNPDTGVPEPVTRYSDTMGNYVSLTETHRITDIAVGLVEVLYASDGVNTDGIFGSNEGALRVFDGTGRLLDRNLTIATHLSNDPPAPLALTMYYDASPPAASLPGLFNSATGLNSRLWLPGVQPGFNTQGNAAARALGADQILDADRLFRNFAISEADEDMVPGSDIDILFRYGDLYCARLEDPADLSSVAPWTIGIAETKRQRGGVTILNNVIDSRRRERTIVQVEVPEAGNIVIQVFTLDGNTVKVLERGRKGAGTYQYFWDGTNNGGRPVARGMYFIRVVGPDIDEIRKVMVVKE